MYSNVAIYGTKDRMILVEEWIKNKPLHNIYVLL